MTTAQPRRSPTAKPKPRRNADLARARGKPLGAVVEDATSVTYGDEDFVVGALSADQVCALGAVNVASQERMRRKFQALLDAATAAGREPDFEDAREEAYREFLSRRTMSSAVAVVLDRDREWVNEHFQPSQATRVIEAADRHNPGIMDVVQLFARRAGLQ